MAQVSCISNTSNGKYFLIPEDAYFAATYYGALRRYHQTLIERAHLHADFHEGNRLVKDALSRLDDARRAWEDRREQVGAFWC